MSHRHLTWFQIAWQDIAAGDGTTSVVVLCGALLKKCLELLQQGVHPTIISDGFNLAVSQAVKVGLLSIIGRVI